MKRIAFLNFDWSYEVTYEYIFGMSQYLKKDQDAELIVFDAFGSFADYEPHMANYEIFKILSLAQFDGIILQGNRAWPADLRQQYADQAAQAGVPCVSINYPLQNSTYIGTDNYLAEKEFILRICKDKKVERPVFINGLAASQEAVERRKAYYDACEELGISHPELIQADWQKETGAALTEKRCEEAKHGKQMPDIFFCCNDDLAIGVTEALKNNGYKVPEDVMVTGFDNRRYAIANDPRITTVDRDIKGIGYNALKTVVKLIDGEPVAKKVYSPVRYIFAGSCGYKDSHPAYEGKDYVNLDNALKNFYAFESRFQPAVFNAGSFARLMKVVESFSTNLEVRNVCLMINDDFLINYENVDAVRHYGNSHVLMAHAGPDLKADCGQDHVYCHFDTYDLYPKEFQSDTRLKIIYPLQVKELCIGYFLTDELSPSCAYGFFSMLLGLIANALEMARQRYVLDEYNQRLGVLYTHDPLTSLYNRFGLNKKGNEVYQRYLSEKGHCAVIFIDVDDMKSINDKYGHEMGDLALKETADIIRKAAAQENAFAMRYGGDEFILIGSMDLAETVKKEEHDVTKSDQRPYHLSLSIGQFLVKLEDHYTLDEAIKKADDEMYETKRNRKEKERALLFAKNTKSSDSL